MVTWLMLAGHVPPGGRGGGMIRYVVELSRALHRTPGIELHVTATPDAADWWAQELGGDDRVHVVRPLPVAARSLVERAGWDPVLRQPFDVVQGAKHLLPRGVAGRTVLTVHDMLPLDRPGDFGFAKRQLLRGPYLASIRQADVIVAVSRATAERLLSYVPEVADRVHVTPLAASRSLVDATPEPIEELVGKAFILMVGDQSERKNLQTVIRAWPEVMRSFPQAVLALVGPPGWAETRLGSQIEELQRSGSLRMLGHVSDQQLRWAYGHASAVAFPSLLEGFGLPAVEARSLGTPLILSEDPALCEASGDYGQRCFSDRPNAWAEAICGALAGSIPGTLTQGPEEWTWAQTASATVAAVMAQPAPERGAPSAMELHP